MLVREVADLFRHYIDEQDTTFIDAVVPTFLKLGYSDFRQTAAHIDPTIHEIQVQFSVAGATLYDFASATNAVRLLGNPGGGLTGPRLDRIVELVEPAVGWPASPRAWYGVRSLTQLTATEPAYLFSRTRLTFPASITATFNMRYIGADSVDWTKIAPADTERIDDLDDWHNLIALLAAKQYAIKDGAFNPQLQAELKSRMDEFKEWLAVGRDLSASTRVNYTYDP